MAQLITYICILFPVLVCMCVPKDDFTLVINGGKCDLDFDSVWLLVILDGK